MHVFIIAHGGISPLNTVLSYGKNNSSEGLVFRGLSTKDFAQCFRSPHTSSSRTWNSIGEKKAETMRQESLANLVMPDSATNTSARCFSLIHIASSPSHMNRLSAFLILSFSNSLQQPQRYFSRMCLFLVTLQEASNFTKNEQEREIFIHSQKFFENICKFLIWIVFRACSDHESAMLYET